MKSAFEKFYNNTIIQYHQLTNQSLYKKIQISFAVTLISFKSFFRNEAENTNIMTRALPLNPVLGSQYILEQLHSL